MTQGDIDGLEDPVAEYDHTGPHRTINGEAAIGGYVYRGTAESQLVGRYVFGDYSHEADERISSGRLFTLDRSGDPDQRVRIVQVDGSDDFPMFVLGFATNASGGAYVLANSTGTLAGRTLLAAGRTRAADPSDQFSDRTSTSERLPTTSGG